MPGAYQENYHYFHEAYKSKNYPWSSTSCVQVEKFLEQILQDSRTDSLLDLGCGEGANVRMAGRVGLRAVGLDREAQAIERAVDLAFQAGLSETVQYLVSDGLALPFASSSFDIILDHGMFHHLKKAIGDHIDRT